MDALTTRTIRDSLHDPRSKRGTLRVIFDTIAPRYDGATRLLSAGRDLSWKRLAVCQLTWLLTTRPARILDIACGTGDMTALLDQAFPRAHVLGVDLSREMLRVARRRDRSRHRHFSAHDMNCMGLRSSQFDLVTGSYALRNAPSLDSTLREVARVLRPGGHALFLEFCHDDNRIFHALRHYPLLAWGALWGLLLHGRPGIYMYLAQSLSLFPISSVLRARLRSHGLHTIWSRKLFMGYMELTACVNRPRATDCEADRAAAGR